MITVISILIVSFSFSFIFYLYQKHLYKLEQLLKAKDLTEYKVMERKEVFVPLDHSEELQDVIQDKSPDEIRGMFSGTV